MIFAFHARSKKYIRDQEKRFWLILKPGLQSQESRSICFSHSTCHRLCTGKGWCWVQHAAGGEAVKHTGRHGCNMTHSLCQARADSLFTIQNTVKRSPRLLDIGIGFNWFPFDESIEPVELWVQGMALLLWANKSFCNICNLMWWTKVASHFWMFNHLYTI